MNWISPSLMAEFAEAETDAYRLATGRGIRVERYAGNILISHESDRVPPTLLDELDSRLKQAGLDIPHVFSRRLVQGPGSQDAPRAVRGYSEVSLARENSMRFEVDFSGGYSCGLFLDQRANRARLRAMQPRRVLNCFAYTCSFSVAGALAGAQTLSVDIAQASLERGRRNFQHNGLSLDGQRFIADDVQDVLPRLARRGDRFDVIILDPPTFSRGRGGRIFRVEKDMPSLLEKAVACAGEGAWILLSTNCLALTTGDLRTMAYPFSNQLEVEPPLPDIAEGDGATTLWLRL